MAVCVAVIGKDNGPLFFKCRPTHPATEGHVGSISQPLSELEYSFIVSGSLDIVEERVQSHHHTFKNPGAVGDVQPVATRELYLGALTAQEEYKVFGYMTNTKVKFIIVVEETSIPLRENDIRMMFRKLHGAFCDLMSNPFYVPGTQIHSKRFEGVINSIIVGQ